MLISKLPGVMTGRWNRKVQNVKRRGLRESDLTDFVQFVEQEILLMNGPLFSREALHEYAGQKENAGNAKHKKLSIATQSQKKKSPKISPQ